MKFHLNRLDLLKAISTINCGVETVSTSPIQGLAHIKVSDSLAYFTAINMDMGIRESIEADVEVGGEVVVDVKKISEWASRCTGEDILFKKNATTLSLKCGKSSFNLKLKDITLPEFPVFGTTSKLNAKDFSNVIDDVIGASEEGNVSRTYSNGIHITITADKISATATQGQILIYSKKASESSMEWNSLIPRKVAQDLKKLLKDSDNVEFTKTDNVTVILTGNSTLFFRNNDSKLPAWRSQLPKNVNPAIIVDSEELRSALSRTAVSLDNETRISVSVTHESISVSSVGNVGDNQEETTCESGEEFQFNVSWRMLSEALKNVKGTARLVYTANNKPLFVYRDGSDEYVAMLALMV